MRQKRMVKIRAGSKICAFFEVRLDNQSMHIFFCYCFWFADVGLDQMKSVKISEDKNFRKTQKVVAKSLMKKF